MPLQAVDDVNFYYETHGAGPDLLLVGGYMSVASDWARLLPHLVKDFRVTIFDNQAAGRTTDQKQVLEIAAVADKIVALSKLLNLQQPAVLGQSLGGSLVQQMAILHPDYFSKLFLCNTVAIWSQRMQQTFAALLQLSQRDITLRELLQLYMPWLRGAKYLSDPKNLEMWVKAVQNNPYPQSAADQARQLSLLQQHNTQTKLAIIKTPSFVVSGDEDVTATPAECKKLADGILNSEFISINCGHGSHLEAPKQIANIVLDRI